MSFLNSGLDLLLLMCIQYINKYTMILLSLRTYTSFNFPLFIRTF